MEGNFSCFQRRLLTFFYKNNFFKKFFLELYQSVKRFESRSGNTGLIRLFQKNSYRNTIRVSNGLDPDKDGHVRPDLDPNCLQRLLADDNHHL